MKGLPVGRIFGITIQIDWSWIFIFLLVTLNLALGAFPRLHPDWGPLLIWGVSLVAAILFFVSVLLHELAHSLVAKAQGMDVRNITLFLFGGVSNIQREPPSPKAEFLIAVVGPITSVVLGIVFLLIGGMTAPGVGGAVEDPSRVFAQFGPLTTLLLWLGQINFLVGLFNLLPGFPLDGGRILRSMLWKLTDNLRKATRWASWAGQVFGWLLIVTGILMVFGVRVPIFGTGLGGLWLAFIGWFLNIAAQQSYQQLIVQDILEGVPVSRLMRSDVPSAQPDASISDLVHERIMGTDEHAFPVLEEDRLVGLVCLEDVRKVPREAWDTTRISEIMTPAEHLTVIGPNEDSGDALSELGEHDVNQLPVVQDGRLVGLLRRRDILRWLQLHSEQARS